MISIQDWQQEYASSRREFEEKGREHAEEFMSSLDPIKKLVLENFWVSRQSARYEAAWEYLKRGN
jgi:hypothetical protein